MSTMHVRTGCTGSVIHRDNGRMRASSELQGPDFVTAFRCAIATAPGAEHALTMTGLAMFCGGVCWGACHFFRAHPYAILVMTGLAIFMAGLASSQKGLVAHLPDLWQDFLLRKTIFDLLHDTADAVNFRRRWSQIMLLTCFGSKEDVAKIAEGMDPQFAQMVFKSSIAELFPRGISRLLLPDHQEPPQLEVCQHGARHADATTTSPVTPTKKWRNAVYAVNAARRLRNGRHASCLEPLTHVEISKALSERNLAIQQGISEPDIVSRFLVLKVRDKLPRWGVVLQALSAFSMCTGTCWLGTWAMLMRSKPAQSTLLSALYLFGIGKGVSKKAIIKRFSKSAGVLSIVNLGCSMALFGCARHEGTLRRLLQRLVALLLAKASRSREVRA